MSTLTQPSAEVKPANQFGSIVWGRRTIGLSAGTTSGKAAFNPLDIPQFIEAFRATILRTPNQVRCSLFLIFIKIFF